MTVLSRSDRSLFTDWWFTVDRKLLTAFLTLFAIGIVVTPAASPAIALRKGFSAFHFVERHVIFATVGVIIMLAVSLLRVRQIRRLSLALYIAAIAAMIAVLIGGEEINGARRWIRLGGVSLQPSEFAKPAFACLSAWAFAEAYRRRDMPALPIAILLYLALAAVLVQQPDVGQTVLVTLVWGALLIVSGQSLAWALGFGVAAAAGLVTAYFSLGYIQARVDRFLAPVPGDRSQVGRALQSFIEGGFFGRGPGEGTIKQALPDAHTDFILAVIAEEYGVAACLLLLMLFLFVTIRPLLKAARDPNMVRRLQVVALALLIAFQALINMGVNVGLLPAKGMTLPFISTGGSSTLAMALTAGLLLALTRRTATVAVATDTDDHAARYSLRGAA